VTHNNNDYVIICLEKNDEKAHFTLIRGTLQTAGAYL